MRLRRGRRTAAGRAGAAATALAAAAAVALPIAILAGARAARADGAFPDSQSVLVPAERPAEATLATNFGLIATSDGGATWTWSCEQEATSFGYLYQLGAAPARRLYALSLGTLAYSDDRGCGWGAAGGALAGLVVSDAFPDPGDASRVLAVARPGGGAAGAAAVLASHDGGATFDGAALYTAADGDDISGVEIARSAPATIYLTLTGSPGFVPKLARTDDGGASWSVSDLSGTLGNVALWLVAVDPEQPARVFLRVAGSGGEALAVTDDGGATVRRVLPIDGGSLTAFARLASGTLIAAASFGGTGSAAGGAATGALYRSVDGGQSFQALAGAPRVRGLAERAGVLYAAADNYKDGFALGTSSDEGTTWQALMRYDQVGAVDACVRAFCADGCRTEADQAVWSAATCEAPADPPSVEPAGSDGGTGGDAGAREPAGGGAGGCGCAVTAGRPLGAAAGAGLIVAALARSRRRRVRAHAPLKDPSRRRR
jgi:hypothetical protein